MGTALGVALTGLVFDLVAGRATRSVLPPLLAERAFIGALALLATTAAAAAAVSAWRGAPPGGPSPDRAHEQEGTR